VRRYTLVRPARTDLVALGRSPGRTAEQVAAQCEKAEGGVLLIDDFHRLMPVGRGLHSSTFRLNLSRFRYKYYPEHHITPHNTSLNSL